MKALHESGNEGHFIILIGYVIRFMNCESTTLICVLLGVEEQSQVDTVHVYKCIAMKFFIWNDC